MKAISLFSGIGGFDLAMERAGIEVDSVCEIDKNAQVILRRHFPNAKLYDDVRNIGANTHARNSIDIITGGFPCQDVSIAGKRAGLAGERSGLWFEFARIIDELEPGWVVIENVPGLLSSNRGADFATIIRWLAERGYGVAWRVLDAQYFGVPQRRRRVFIVASLGSGRAAQVLFERESGGGNTPPSRQAGEAVAGTFTVRSGKDGGGKGYLGMDDDAMTLSGQPQWLSPALRSEGHDGSEDGRGRRALIPVAIARESGRGYWMSSDVSGTLDKNMGDSGHASRPAILCMAHGQANAEIVSDGSPSLTRNEAPIVFQQNQRNEVRDMGTAAGALAAQPGMHSQNFVIPPLRASGGVTSSPTLNKNNTDLDFLIWHNHQQDGSVRIQDDGTAPTVSRQWETGGNNVPFVGVRRLTPLECERLQGFPDGWTDGQSDSARYRQLGNAVAVPVVEWIMRRLANHSPTGGDAPEWRELPGNRQIDTYRSGG